MKKMILSMILGIITLVSFSQEAFVMGKTYPQGWIVWYPSYGTFWAAKSATSFIAKTTPNLDPTHWNSYTYPVTNTVPVPVLTLDSLEKRVKLAESNLLLLQNTLNGLQQRTGIVESKLAATSTIAYVDTQLKPINDKIAVLSAQGDKTIRISKWGIPLVSFSKDSSIITLKSLIATKYISTDSTVTILQ